MVSSINHIRYIVARGIQRLRSFCWEVVDFIHGTCTKSSSSVPFSQMIFQIFHFFF